jgi:selenocysteine lyase/cysteine desulfurase
MDKLYQFYLDEYGKPDEAHSLSQKATKVLDEAHKKMADFIFEAGTMPFAEIITCSRNV